MTTGRPTKYIDRKGRINEIYFADPDKIPTIKEFVGRKEKLKLCRAAWGLDPNGEKLSSKLHRLHFRLQSAPGFGKNEIVYQIVRKLTEKQDIPFYMIQGHEELTPEDLALLLVPDPNRSNSSKVPLVLRASPLATAIYEGGIFFFDEINRVPERALSPLSSVLDSRQYIYSAITGIHIEPKDDEARKRFRFCCALNPEVSIASRGVLPEYIEQRTLPVIEIGKPSSAEMREIVEKNLELDPDSPLLKEFDEWYKKRANKNSSIRKALSLIMLAKNLGGDISEAFKTSAGHQMNGSAD